ncbi:MAG: diguanylate cyclase [Pseudomonadota bacterium]
MSAVSDPPAARARRGLRWRLILSFATVAVALGLIGCLAVGALAGRLIWLAQREQGLSLLQALAPTCARAIATEDIAALDDILAEALQAVHPSHANIALLQAYDSRGHLLVSAQDPRYGGAAAALEPDFLACALDGDAACWRHRVGEGDAPLLLLSVPADSGLRWGSVVAVMDLSPLDARLRKVLAGVICTVIVLDLVALAVLTLWVSRLVLGPVERLGLAVARMRAGDLSARAGLTCDDELGLLGQGFDAMAARLQAYTTDLEREVAERSARIRRQHDELERVNQDLARINLHLERLVSTDALTGLYNRRYLEQALAFEISRAQRAAHPFSLLILDIDRFKSVNDTWGHPCGDRVLVHLGAILRESLRATDLRARWGGEEFVVLLLDTDHQAALTTAEKLRARVEAAHFERPDGERLFLTISIGMASFPGDARDGESLFAEADKALFRAKEGGRNRVEVAG